MLVPSSDWAPMIQSLELKKLCSRILQKTINDSDKYQNGLTKIFFRAGMLAALESLRVDRLNALVTVVQKNMRRRMAVKKYQELRKAAIRIQTWWRGIMARKLVHYIRCEVAAIRLQKGIRRFIQRKKFLDIKHGVTLFQSRKLHDSITHSFHSRLLHRCPWCPGSSCIPRGADGRCSEATPEFVPWSVSRHFFYEISPHSQVFYYRFVRRSFKSDVRHVIYIQSCMRRRFARKELKALKAEARSVSKFKEISYKLENKVVELTQTLQKRTEEKKSLQANLSELEQQLQQWVTRHEESDGRAKQFQLSFQSAEAELSRRDELLQAKAGVEKRLEEAIGRAAEREETIQKLTDDLIRQANQLEAQQKAIDTAPARTTEDSSVILTLKNEVSNLREQLNRANALNSLTRGGRGDAPVSPTFAPALRMPEMNGTVNGATSHSDRHRRRHSSAGVFGVPADNRGSMEGMMAAKRNQAMNPRAVSVAYNGEDNFSRYQRHGLPDIRDFDDPAEEKIRLMQDMKHLDEDVLEGLVRGLKIPAPSLTNPSAVKEILFPANLISLVTNEMWKYGLIPESERFLANVMQTVQAHVMVN